MKYFLLFSFILFCAYSHAQNYMMTMDVQATVEDSTTYSCNTKVIWGAREREIMFIWNDKVLHFYKRIDRKTRSKATRKAIEKFIEDKNKEIKSKKEKREYNKSLKLRDLFYNQWGELFLITVYMERNVLVIINRIDGKFPHYSFTMVLNKEP